MTPTTTTSAAAPALGVAAIGDGTYAVASSRPGHAPYIVRALGDTFACTCPDSRFRAAHDPSYRCKHALATLASRLLASSQAEQSWAARVARNNPRRCPAPGCMAGTHGGEVHCPRHRHLGQRAYVRVLPAGGPSSACREHPDRVAQHYCRESDTARCTACYQAHLRAEGQVPAR